MQVVIPMKGDMKRMALLVLLSVWPLFGFSEELTLQSAAAMMLERNPVLAQKRLQVEASDKRLDAARSEYYPRVDFSQTWSRSNNPVYVFGTLLNQRHFGPENFAIDSLNDPDPLSDYSSRFQLGWLLYDFGGRESRIGVSDAAASIADLQQQAVRTALLQELVRRYYAVSLSQHRVDTAEEHLKSAESRRAQALDRVDQGLAVSTELLSAEVFLARKKQEKLDAENNFLLAQAALKELLGGSGMPPFETDPLSEKKFSEHPLSWWAERMNNNRPELKIAAEGKRLASAQVSGSRATFLPALKAWSAYEWHGENLDYSGKNWGIGAELSWNLFSGFSNSAQYSAAKLQEREALEKEREVQNNLALQLESAYYKFHNAQEKWRVAAAVLDQATENKRIHADRYSAGLVSIQDTLQAEADYSESKFYYLQNLYEVHVARAELLGAAGMPDQIISEEQL
jgi:outer membrane protein TolC